MAQRKPQPRHPVICVEWLDASDAFGQWSSADVAARNNDHLAVVQSVGYLVEVHDDHLTLATSTVHDPPEYGGGIHIPRALIQRQTRLA
jgi:hypothetical protein